MHFQRLLLVKVKYSACGFWDLDGIVAQTREFFLTGALVIEVLQGPPYPHIPKLVSKEAKERVSTKLFSGGSIFAESGWSVDHRPNPLGHYKLHCKLC